MRDGVDTHLVAHQRVARGTTATRPHPVGPRATAGRSSTAGSGASRSVPSRRGAPRQPPRLDRRARARDTHPQGAVAGRASGGTPPMVPVCPRGVGPAARPNEDVLRAAHAPASRAAAGADPGRGHRRRRQRPRRRRPLLPRTRSSDGHENKRKKRNRGPPPSACRYVYVHEEEQKKKESPKEKKKQR